ncbi:alpha/beta fold hydrolase [Marispirochaeta sp.]|jgi:carboxylesterase|uniref:alpha/beta hydrolase n=1 Tax=Marispirochaeta sp. TaxID=2038653 RepID=UPI0029C64D3B|nr:alpha/beta fold hydrolase [Marispirochaeta sp.]
MNKRPHIVNSAEPRYLAGTRSTSVLLIHGWSGYPGQLYFLGDKLHEAGYGVMIPRLPGHGTNAGDFLDSSARDWIRRAEDAYMDLSIRAERIVVAGISMGALLALHVGAVFNPEAVIAAAPALAFKNRSAYLSPVLHYIIKEIPVVSDTVSEDPDENFIRGEYWSSRKLAAVAELVKVRHTVKKKLPLISMPLLILEAGQDELVPPKAVTILTRMVTSEDVITLLFPESSHQLFNGQEKQAVAEEIINWLEKRFPET